MSTLVSPVSPLQDLLRPPERNEIKRGLAFAMAAHVLLVAALSLGVNWRSQQIPAAEAELWAAVPQAAAPREQLPPEEPAKAEPDPEPPKPQPKPPEPDPRELQAQRDAEIAIAKAKDRKLKEEQQAREAEQARQRKLEQERRELQDKKERERKDALKKEQEQREQKEREQKDRDKKKEQAAKDAKAQRDAEAKREALRQENLRRIAGMAGASGAPNATGSALKSAGPSANYAGRIKARIRPNVIYSDPGGSANPEAEVRVNLLPDGKIIGSQLLRASGDAEWDKAVLRAIEKTGDLPRDTDGRVPAVIVITFRPRD
jgi:colicin import membrane protein